MKEINYDHRLSTAGFPQQSKSKVVFSNGVLDLDTGEFSQFSPEVFSLRELCYPFDLSSKECSRFHGFLDTLCDGHVDRKKFLQVMINLVLKSNLDLQVFFYIHGPGASGKSLFVLLLTLLVGESSVHTTNFKALTSDPFETINLANKGLIVLNDSEEHIAEMSILKALVGNDTVRGRIMRQNETR